MRRVHPDKDGNNPGTTLAQHNLVDANKSLKREREIEDERERNNNRIRVHQREEKRKRENESNKKIEKEKREIFEVRDSYTSESYSDDNSHPSLYFHQLGCLLFELVILFCLMLSS